MNQFAPAKRIHSFHPPQRTLMGPGPSEINPRVMAAMGLPAIGYLDPIFVEMMEELKGLLRYAFQTKNALTFPVSGPGSVGMEYCFVNLVAPGDKVIVCRNGVFGGRMIENVERCGGVPDRRRGRLGRAGRSQQARGRAEGQPGHARGRVRARRDLHRRAVRRQDPGRDRAQARRAHHRRCGHLAGRHTGAGGRMERRRHLLGQPEMPVVHAGPVAGVLQRPRGRLRQGAQGQDPQLVHGHEPAAGLLGRHQPHLSPHRADQQPVRAARGAADPEGRRHRERLGAPPAPSSGAQGRPRGDGAEVPGEGSRTGCRR